MPYVSLPMLKDTRSNPEANERMYVALQNHAPFIDWLHKYASETLAPLMFKVVKDTYKTKMIWRCGLLQGQDTFLAYTPLEMMNGKVCDMIRRHCRECVADGSLDKLYLGCVNDLAYYYITYMMTEIMLGNINIPQELQSICEARYDRKLSLKNTAAETNVTEYRINKTLYSFSEQSWAFYKMYQMSVLKRYH